MSTAIEIWNALGFVIPLLQARINIGVSIMKKVFVSGILAASFAVPSLSFAQSTAPVTHASLQAEIVQLQKAGYNPSQKDINYPSGIQAAEAKIAKTQSRQGVQ